MANESDQSWLDDKRPSRKKVLWFFAGYNFFVGLGLSIPSLLLFGHNEKDIWYFISAIHLVSIPVLLAGFALDSAQKHFPKTKEKMMKVVVGLLLTGMVIALAVDALIKVVKDFQ